jgi:hypothetical protein
VKSCFWEVVRGGEWFGFVNSRFRVYGNVQGYGIAELGFVMDGSDRLWNWVVESGSVIVET